ncbi:MAG TPA: hypothetical protein VJ836_03395 [Candidatus Saccharimonadales bacterium]|nr:hypothetical protein [Candidatus Saccharimonadales bacterium]
MKKGGLTETGQVTRRAKHRWFDAPNTVGFTVIEVMIVLAVTGMLFVAAAVMIAGRQNRTAFEQAIQDIQAQIRQTLNEVSVGYYPNTSNFQCTGAGSPTISAGAAAQGSNNDCVFVGKVMQFRVSDTDPEQYVTYTLAGLKRGGPGAADTASISEARPVAIAPSTSHPAWPDNSVKKTLRSGLRTERMWYNTGAADQPIGAVAFTTYGAAAAITPSVPQVHIIPIATTTINATESATTQIMNSDGDNRIATSPINPSRGVNICFAGTGINKSGLITIGGTGSREVSVSLSIRNGTAC